MLFCFVGNTFRKSDSCVCVCVWGLCGLGAAGGEGAGREKKKEEEEEEEEKEEEEEGELGREGGRQDLICQEDYRLSSQKLLV